MSDKGLKKSKKVGLKKSKKVVFDSVSTLFSLLFNPFRPRGPGAFFSTFWGVSGPKGPNNSCERPRQAPTLATKFFANGLSRFAGSQSLCSETSPLKLVTIFRNASNMLGKLVL